MGSSGSVPARLRDAVTSGDAETVTDHLEENHEDINQQDDWGNTPLHIALHHGRLNMADVLLSQGADCNLQSRDGEGALHVAARQGYLSVCKRMVENGANVNLMAFERRTPLHFAAFEDRPHVASQLLLDGADPELTTSDGETALHVAAFTGARDVVVALLDGGANVNARRKDGMTSLLLAMKEFEEQTAQLLLDRGADVTITSQNGKTALHFAAYRGMLGIVRQLLARGMDVNSQAEDGVTALHEACTLGQLAVVKVLLDAGAEVNRAAHTYVRVIAFLRVFWKVNFGVSHEPRFIPGCTALLRAAENDNEDVVEILLKNGASVLTFDNHGQCPLHWAVRNNSCSVVHRFLKQGTPFCLTDANGYNALGFYFFHVNAHAAQEGRPVLTEHVANMAVLFIQHGMSCTKLETGEGQSLQFKLCERHNPFPLRVYQAALNSGEDVASIASEWLRAIHTFQRDKKDDIVRYVRSISLQKQPLLLTQWCRIKLRAHLCQIHVDRSIWNAAVALPLPKVLVSFILLQEYQNAVLPD